jgi:DNA repair protein RadC
MYQSQIDSLRRALRDFGLTQSKVDRVVAAYPGGAGIGAATAAELQRCGLTARQAASLRAAFGIVRAVDTCSARDVRHAARAPGDVVRILRAELADLDAESFVCVYLDARQRVITVREIGRGSLAAVDVHPREAFKYGVRANAHSVILAHNHPSGDPEPSEADQTLTRRMVEVGRVVGIPVLDHIVVTRDAWTSFSALGLLG